MDTRTRLASLADLLMKVAIIASMAVIATITIIDVIGRYIFNAPLPGAFEIQEFTMAVLIFSGLPLVTSEKGHITVSLFDGVFRKSRAVFRLQRTLINLVSACVIAFLGYLLWREGMTFIRWGGESAYLGWPYFPLAFFMSAMAALTSLVLAAHALATLAGYADPNAPEGEGWKL